MAGGTNFEGINHPQLKSMVVGSDPAKVTSRGNQLKDAGRVLDDLSRALAAHVGQIQWEGPAAENFKAWAGNLNKSASMISEYSKGAGDAMVQAGEALGSAKTGVPEVPTKDIDVVKRHVTQPCLKPSPLSIAGIGNPTATTDAIMKKEDPTWVSYAEAAAAQKRVDTAHQEAIHQMEKLGQAYEAATAKLNGLKLPELPGTPGDGPKAVDGGTEVPVGPGGRSYGSGGGGRSSGGGYSGGGYVPAGGGGYGGGGGSVVAPRPRTSVPDAPQTPGRSVPTPPHGGSVPLPGDPGTSGVVTPPTTFPGDRPSTGLDSLPSVPTLPGQTGPVGPSGGGPVSPHPQGGGPGYPGLPGGGPGPFAGGGPIPMGGTGPFTGGTVPLKGGGGGSVPPNRTSTFGGGNLPAKGGAPVPTNGGTVFGSREAAQGRAGGPAGGGGFGGPGGGVHPGGGYGGGVVGGSRGRGYSSTGGGVVGGVVGGAKGPVAGGEFTPGGSGLRSRAASAGAAAAESAARPGQNGMMGPGMMGGGAGERRERERGRRADYLHEDEETWTSGTPKSNPGVIE
ncbi:WXG100 family type VII secretion target [Kitasatospora sp. NPDC059463]|uniref:WXG100 family type VII secretion target n=1 Tax=unclassified Kitasatospora TaxID=2633591 RepID=UPI0036821D06